MVGTRVPNRLLMLPGAAVLVVCAAALGGCGLVDLAGDQATCESRVDATKEAARSIVDSLPKMDGALEVGCDSGKYPGGSSRSTASLSQLTTAASAVGCKKFLGRDFDYYLTLRCHRGGDDYMLSIERRETPGYEGLEVTFEGIDEGKRTL